MKNLKSITAAICLVAIGIAAKANKTTKEERAASPVYAIHTYADAMSHGKIDGLAQVIDRSAKFSMKRGSNLLSSGKDDMLTYAKENKNIQQNCVTNSSLINVNADMAMAKITMHYPGFTRTNYVTLTHTGNGWKITDVYSVIK